MKTHKEKLSEKRNFYILTTVIIASVLTAIKLQRPLEDTILFDLFIQSGSNDHHANKVY